MKTNKFNLEMFKNGAKAQTKLGNPVRFITVANNGKLIVAVTPRFGLDEQSKYNLDGTKNKGVDSPYDLVMLEEYEEIA